MKCLLQMSTEGSISLKIPSFLITQMIHAMSMMISICKGVCNFSFICLKIFSKGLVVITDTPMEAQQALAKLQRRNKWVTDSIFCRMQRSQVYDSSSIFLLLSSSLVLSLSLNQKNTLCFV